MTKSKQFVRKGVQPTGSANSDMWTTMISDTSYQKERKRKSPSQEMVRRKVMHVESRASILRKTDKRRDLANA